MSFINDFEAKEDEARKEELKKKIEADKKAFVSCYLVVDNKLQIHIYDKILQRRYLFTTDLNIKPYIDELKAKGYYEFVQLDKKQQNKDEEKVNCYLEFRCPFELYERGANWQIISLHHLVIAVNTFEPKADFESIKKANTQRSEITKSKNKSGKYGLVVDHISNRKNILPFQQSIVFDNVKTPTEPGEIYPKLTPAEEQAYKEFCEILPKLDEDFFDEKVIYITPTNLNHAQSCNEFDNLVFLDSRTNTLKSKILDKHLGLYAGIKHSENIFVVTFYTQASFNFNEDKSHRFSVIHKLPTSDDKIEQIVLQAKALKKIYEQYNIASEEAQEIYENYNRQNTSKCWNDIKKVYSLLFIGKEIHYVTAEDEKKDFNNLYLNKEVFFAPGDERVKKIIYKS